MIVFALARPLAAVHVIVEHPHRHIDALLVVRAAQREAGILAFAADPVAGEATPVIEQAVDFDQIFGRQVAGMTASVSW